MDTQSSTPKRLAIGGALVGLALAVVLILVSRDASDETGAPAATATSPVPRSAEPALPGDPTAAAGAPSAPPSMRPMLTPEELIAQVLQKDKKLGQFMKYHKSVLLDSQRRDEYRKLLSDRDMMLAMAEGLMQPGSGIVEPEEQYHRLMQIDYFDAALTWKDNPQRDQVLALTGDIIAKDNFSGDQNTDRRQMLAGGKMELYRLMYEQDPAKATAMVAQAKGTRMESLVNWMSQEELRRRDKEEQIRKEMQELQAKAQ